MVGLHFKKIDFGIFKKYLGLKKTEEEEWTRQENGVLVKPLISDEESIRLNLTYIGLKFDRPTDAHFYKNQTDVICFKTDGIVEFCDGYFLGGKSPQVTDKEKTRTPFPAGYAIEIPPPVVRKIVPKPTEKKLEIELVVRPRFDSKDEVHVYD